jgi:putative membrane protein
MKSKRKKRLLKASLMGLGGGLFGVGLGLLARRLWCKEGRSQIGPEDERFVKEAAAAGLEEIALGHVAGQRGQREEVRALAQRLIRDHTQTNSELTALVLRKGFVPPGYLPKKQQATVECMAGLNPEQFDARFAAQMVREHREAIGLFQREAAGGEDPELRALAQKVLPVLHEHLRLALALA